MSFNMNQKSAFQAAWMTLLPIKEGQSNSLTGLLGKISMRCVTTDFSSKQVSNVACWLIGFCCLLAGGASMADSVWTTGGTLRVARYAHTATLLINGKVLVAGGMSNEALASTELYDPATNAWTLAAAMSTPRSGHRAVLLPDGKVLVVGGDATSATAEIYDPATNTWRSANQLKTPRSAHTATLLTNGRVLVAGGFSSNVQPGISPYPTSVEMYDQASNTWMDVPPLLIGRFHHTTTLLPNAKVLVSGGGLGTSIFIPADSELYDLTMQTWVTADALAQSRGLHTATPLLDGKVLVAAGFGSGGVLASAELYDPGTASWINAGSLSTARNSHTATRLPDGAVLVAGGTGNGYPRELNSTERFDPTTNTWTIAAPLVTPRMMHTATLLPNGKVLVAGGTNEGSPAGLAITELFETGYAGTTTRVAQFASRATVTPSQSVYGAFVLADPAKLFIAVRGPSLGVLGVSPNPHPHPYLNLFTGSGQLVASSNQCAGATADNAAVVAFYRDVRQQALSTNDACLGYVTSALPAGIYTFYIVPDPSVSSSSGEVLFEVTPAQ